jgi:2-polyprenyl-3-methyl-5-hydroxy-6-metoxy-1,4-benzoquinol methylase
MCGASARTSMTLPHAGVFRCENRACDLQFAAPQLNDQDLSQAYAALYYRPDGSAAVLHTKPEADARHFLNLVAQALGPVAGRRILDYGCGHGMLLKVANSLGAESTGIEQSAAAREAIGQQGIGRAYADIAELRKSAPEARFDWIVLVEVIEHLRRPWEDLDLLRQMLAEGGRIVVVTPNAASLRSRVRGRHWDQRLNLTHFYYFTARSLTAVLRRAGLTPGVLPPIAWYSEHGALRRQLQRVLGTLGMQGDLIFAGSAGTAQAPQPPRVSELVHQRGSATARAAKI